MKFREFFYFSDGFKTNYMLEYKPLLDYVRKFMDISDDDFAQLILPGFFIREFAKKDIILSAGETEDYFGFVLSGLVRKYYCRGKEQVNTQFSSEGHIMHAQESFFGRVPSEYFIETIEPTRMASISYANLQQMFERSHRMEHLGRLVVTNAMVVKDRYQMKMIRLTARERFMDFVKRNPNLMQRIPQKMLASYLNIQPETFSRFKHLLRNR